MRNLMYLLVEMLAPAVILPPVMAIYGIRRGLGARKTIVCILLAVYIAGVYHMTGLPDVLYHRFEPNIQMIPFRGMAADARNEMLNVVLFLPLGFFLPLLWKGYRSVWRTAAVGAAVSALIETMQIFSFRATDINDVITNTLGAVLGCIAAKALIRRMPELRTEGSRMDAAVPCVTAALFMFFPSPFIFTALWEMLFG